MVDSRAGGYPYPAGLGSDRDSGLHPGHRRGSAPWSKWF